MIFRSAIILGKHIHTLRDEEIIGYVANRAAADPKKEMPCRDIKRDGRGPDSTR